MGENPLDWAKIRLVVFDVDGTLYRQSTLRRRMLKLLIRDALTRRSMASIRILRDYRTQRERLAEEEAKGFEPILRRRVAENCGVSDQTVANVVTEWIERRPLMELGQSLYPDIIPLFDVIRRSGRKIGVLSDYPVADKLQALGLEADYTVAAGDPEVEIMKPHPAGLQYLMRIAGESSDATLLIGDRAERDGAAARRAGVAVLLRSKAVPGYHCVESFDDLACALGKA
jgi:HAD superfamily hydrolase (TIGR01549 family)